MLDCPKLHGLSDRAFRCWAKLIVTALRNGGRNGELPPLRMLVFRIRMSEQEIMESIEEMRACFLLEPCPHNPIGGMPWRIHDWDHWQAPKDKTSAERQARWRDRSALRNALHNGVINGKVTRDITTTMEEGKKEEVIPPFIPPKGKKKQEPFVCPQGIPESLFADFIESRSKNGRKMTERAKELLANRLLRLKAEGHDIGNLLESAIEGAWHTIRDPKKLPWADKHKPPVCGKTDQQVDEAKKLKRAWEQSQEDMQRSIEEGLARKANKP